MAPQVRLLSSLLIIALFSRCGVAGRPKKQVFNAADIQVRMENAILTKDGIPFTGIIYALQPNRKDTAEIVAFRDGKEDGVWKKFYPGGRLQEIREFADGKKTGAFLAWWPNGKKKLDYFFEEGEYNGTCREWAESGLLVSEMNYKMGYEDGAQKQYYANGKIKANYIMIGGRRYGLLGTKNCVNVAAKIFNN